MNKEEVREFMKEEFDEINWDEYSNFNDIGECVFFFKPDNIYFKPKEKKQIFPIKIKTKKGYVNIGSEGNIAIYNIDDEISCIASTELEQFQEIIKEAIKVRDKK